MFGCFYLYYSSFSYTFYYCTVWFAFPHGLCDGRKKKWKSKSTQNNDVLKRERIKAADHFSCAAISCVFTLYTHKHTSVMQGDCDLFTLFIYLFFFTSFVVLLVLKPFHFNVLVTWWFRAFSVSFCWINDTMITDLMALTFDNFFFFAFSVFFFLVEQIRCANVTTTPTNCDIRRFTWFSWSLMWKEPSKWSLKLPCARE